MCTIWETCFLLILSLFFLASFCKRSRFYYFFIATTLVNRSTQTENSAQHFFSLQHIYFFFSLWAFVLSLPTWPLLKLFLNLKKLLLNKIHRHFIFKLLSNVLWKIFQCAIYLKLQHKIYWCILDMSDHATLFNY